MHIWLLCLPLTKKLEQMEKIYQHHLCIKRKKGQDEGVISYIEINLGRKRKKLGAPLPTEEEQKLNLRAQGALTEEPLLPTHPLTQKTLKYSSDSFCY